MYAELPGVDPSQIDITCEQNVLTIRGTKPSNVQAVDGGDVRVYAAERVKATSHAPAELSSGRPAEISNS